MKEERDTQELAYLERLASVLCDSGHSVGSRTQRRAHTRARARARALGGLDEDEGHIIATMQEDQSSQIVEDSITNELALHLEGAISRSRVYREAIVTRLLEVFSPIRNIVEHLSLTGKVIIPVERKKRC